MPSHALTRALVFLMIMFCYVNFCAAESKSFENFTLEENQKLPRSERSKSLHLEIQEVLSSPDFARQETVKGWRFKDLGDKKNRSEKVPEWLIGIIEFFESNADSLRKIALVLEVLIWAVVIGLALFIFVHYRRRVGRFIREFGKSSPEPELPTTMFGLDLKKTSIPEDVVAHAEQHWNSQEPRLAVAALLSASLIKLIHEHGCRFFDSDTEAECCQRIDQQVASNLSVYMRELVAVWQSVAYAHVVPTTSTFKQLCKHWREVFDAR